MKGARVDTDIYITDKAEIKRLPEDKPKPSKKEQKELDKKATESKPPITPKVVPKVEEEERNVLGNREQKGPCYRMLKPEVK